MKTPTEEQAKEAAKLLREIENVDNLASKLIEQCTGYSAGIRTDGLRFIISEYASNKLMNPE